jgi:hypothetical protein
MTLLDDWKEVLKKAWSVRLIALAAILSGIEVVLPMFAADIPQGIFAALSGFVTAGALLARVVAQPDKSA